MFAFFPKPLTLYTHGMKRVHLSFSLRLISMTLILLIFGLIMVYSASVAEGARDFGSKWHFVLLQLRWAGAGLLGMLVVSRIPPRVWEKLAPAIATIGLLLLLLVAIPGIGTKVQGARRWIATPLINIQPAELMKFIEVVYLSSWLARRKVSLAQFGFFVALIGGLVMLQPDMGTTLVLTSIAILMYFLHGYPIKNLLLLGGVGLVIGSLLIIAEPYRLARVKTFLDPTHDTTGSSYHMRQVLLALGSGGMTGVGIGRSRQKYEYLPEATTDSIFAVAGEEMGFLGAVMLIASFIYFLSLVLKVAAHARDSYAASLAAGVAAWIGTQVVLNLAAMVAFTPLTGIPLPLVSYGGSALVTMLAGVGLVLSVARSERL